MWKLLNFKTLAHSNDIKAVCDASLSSLSASNDDASIQFLTASRDSTVKLWNFSSKTGECEEVLCVEEHEGFVNSVAFLKDISEYPKGLIISGGSDKLINLWDCSVGKLCGTLIAHSQNICKLITFKRREKTFPYIFGSTSWDGTARCWTEEFSPNSCLILNPNNGDDNKNNAGTCWSMAAMGRDIFITGHADRSIRIWRGDCEVQVISEAHKDVVRDLVPLNNGNDLEFVSVGNDGAIKVWNASTGKLIQNIEGAHSAYIYGLTIFDDRIASYGEGGIVKIWKRLKENNNFTFELENVLKVPMMSVWGVTFINNGNFIIIIGSSKSIYIFNNTNENESVNVNVNVSDDIFKDFEIEMEQFNKSANETKAAEIEKNVQDISVLKTFGSRIGQTLLVRNSKDSKIIEAHQWNGSEWQNMGQVQEENGDLNDSIKLSSDFSFKVELDNTGRMYDLNYNTGENPYVVGKDFLERNDLPIFHLDEVANFIVNNAGIGGDTSKRFKREECYALTPKNLTFTVEAYNAEGINSKLKSFGLKEISVEEILKILTSNAWPVNKLFPCLDFLRVEVLNLKRTEGNEKIEKIFSAVPFDLILKNGTIIGASKEAIAAVTMTLRLLCNASACKNYQIEQNLIMEVIEKCVNQEIEIDIMITWIPLLIGLLYNVNSYLDSLKSLSLLHVILYNLNTKSNNMIKIDECHRICEIIKPSVQLIEEEKIKMKRADIKKEIEKCNFENKNAEREILELLQ